MCPRLVQLAAVLSSCLDIFRVVLGFGPFWDLEAMASVHFVSQEAAGRGQWLFKRHALALKALDLAKKRNPKPSDAWILNVSP